MNEGLMQQLKQTALPHGKTITVFLVNNYGMWQPADRPIHGKNVHDKIFISRPDFHRVTIYCSLIRVKTRHMTVLVQHSCSETESGVIRYRHKVRLRYA
jgi:hypothetical protein